MRICHIGRPCDPPIVEGVEFELLDDNVWVAEVENEELAQRMLSIPSYYQNDAPGGDDASEDGDRPRKSARKTR